MLCYNVEATTHNHFLLTADQKMRYFVALLVESPTTSQQPNTDAEPKTVVSANALGRRSSRGGFSSSSNLKIKTEPICWLYS